MIRALAILAVGGLLVGCSTFTPPETLPGRQPTTDYDSGNQYAPRSAPNRVALPTNDPSCKTTREILAREFGGNNRPPLMAIGDSLYNGVQSLRINWYLSEWSAPSLVALRLGLIEERVAARTGDRKFFGPQYPSYGQNVDKTLDFGFNLERLPGGGLVSNALGLGGLPSYQAAALHFLMSDYLPPNKRAMVDNLAFSGASSVDVDTWRAIDHRRHADRLLAEQRAHPLSTTYLGDAFTSANAAFVLNPTRNACIDAMTPLDQVLLREPERLIVNIGANNGIWAVSFSGATLDANTCGAGDSKSDGPTPRCDGSIDDFLQHRLIRDLQSAGQKLAGSHVKFVYINGVTEPSRPANMLLSRSPDGPHAQTDLFIPTALSLAELARADRAADATNAALRNLVESLNVLTNNGKSGPVFTFVDAGAKLAALDYKGCVFRQEEACDARRLHISARRLNDGSDTEDVYLDNRPYEVGAIPKGRHYPQVLAGGLFSLDNMHLSSVGYEVMARAVTDKMAENGDPLMEGGKDCKGPNDQGYLGARTPVGSCRYLLTLPGYAFTDINRRKQVPLRVLSRADEQKLRDLQQFVEAFKR